MFMSTVFSLAYFFRHINYELYMKLIGKLRWSIVHIIFWFFLYVSKYSFHELNPMEKCSNQISIIISNCIRQKEIIMSYSYSLCIIFVGPFQKIIREKKYSIEKSKKHRFPWNHFCCSVEFTFVYMNRILNSNVFHLLHSFWERLSD